MTSQDYASAFYRKYRSLPDALRAYRSEKTRWKRISQLRADIVARLLEADADSAQLVPVALADLRRTYATTSVRSADGIVAREIREVLEDLVPMYLSPRSFFKEGGRWSAHFGGEILLVRVRRARGRPATQILGQIARRWGAAPFEFNKGLAGCLESAPPKQREFVDQIIRGFAANREEYEEGRPKGAKDSKPRLTTGRVEARNLEVDAETRATRGSDLDRDGAGNQAEAIRRVAARRGWKRDTVKKGLYRKPPL